MSSYFNKWRSISGPENTDQAVKHGRRYLLVILFLGLIVRVAQVLNASSIEMDGVSYALIAEAITNGSLGEATKAVFPPFYPFFIALAHLLIGDYELAGRFVSLVCGVLLIYVCYLFFRRFLGERKALYGSFILAIHPYLIRYSGQVLSESLATLLFVLTVFFFYHGWTEARGSYVVLSSFFLALTYLTRPEYIVYSVPFAILLISRKQFLNTLLFLVIFAAPVLAFIFNLRLETGLWMISRKSTLLPVVSLADILTNIPLVTYHFLAAIFPPFILLLLWGFRRVDAPYRSLVVMLVIFHVLTLSMVGHSTRRYSVEFIPLMVLFAAEGVSLLIAFIGQFRYRRAVALAACILFIFLPLTQAVSFHERRSLHKEAGLFLLKKDPGSRIASRLPIESFYAKGLWIDLAAQCKKFQECEGLIGSLNDQATGYAVFDNRIMEQCSHLEKCLSGFPCIADFSSSEGYVRVYRARNE